MPAKILVVEDHPDSREILVFQLRHVGYEVIDAETGLEAVEKALVEYPDLIIMDLGLPGINGIEATARLKQDPRTAHIPVIALTAWRQEEYKDKSEKTGMAAFLIKPTPLKTLQEVIERFLPTKS